MNLISLRNLSYKYTKFDVAFIISPYWIRRSSAYTVPCVFFAAKKYNKLDVALYSDRFAKNEKSSLVSSL